MSKKGDRRIDGYIDYVVPPLEGFWWQDGIDGLDYQDKDSMRWISAIRLPDFVKEDDFEWAVRGATEKKGMDYSKVGFLSVEEGLCVQCMHIGPYDDEPRTVQSMEDYAEEHGYDIDISDSRRHHEIYLSDARRVPSEKLKTVIRHPIRKK